MAGFRLSCNTVGMRSTSGLVALLAFVLALLVRGEDAAPSLLTEAEWRAYLETPAYEQPKWLRHDYTMSTPHLLLERAAESHQQGDLEKTVEILKSVLRSDPEHGEAYAALSKVLNDQGKPDLADRAMAKATRIYNDGLAKWRAF